MAAKWSTTRQKSLPAAANGATVTPSGTAWVSGAWATIGTPAADSILTGVTYRTLNDGYQEFEIDIGVGGAGSETVVATINGYFRAISGCSNDGMFFRFPIPIDALVSGVRVAARIRLHVTDVTVWNVSIAYQEKPLVGSVQTTTQPSRTYPSASNFPLMADGGSGNPAWTNGAWVQLAAATSADIVIIAATVWVFSGHVQDFELDIGTGAAGFETAIWTLKGNIVQNGAPFVTPFPNPLDNIVAGSRVSMRVRADVTFPYGSADWYPALCYMEKPL